LLKLTHLRPISRTPLHINVILNILQSRGSDEPTIVIHASGD